MNKLLYTLVAAPLVFGMAGCATLSAPVTPVSPELDASITSTFTALNVGLSALAFIPGMPAVVVKEANALNLALQAAYTEYKRDPTATNQVAIVQSAIRAAQEFMASQAKQLKALHAPLVQ